MTQSSPSARDRAQRKVRSITVASAAGAGVLTLAGLAITAGTFGGRTVAGPSTQAAPTQDSPGGLQQPVQPPGDGGSGSTAGGAGAPIVSGGS